MSFDANQEDDQNQSQVDQNQQGGTGLGQATAATPGSQTDISLGGGGTGVVAPGPQGPAMGSTTGKPSSSGSWTNLQNYLDANKDQGASLGTQVTGAVSGQANQAQNDIDQATKDFQGQADQNTVQQDQTGVNQAISDATNAKAGGTYDPNELAGFQKQANANYGGPTDFTKDQYYGQAQNDLSKAQNSLQAVGSEAGRDTLLQNQFGGTGTYNQGQQSLDQLLLEGNPTNQSAFQNLQGQWGGLNHALTDATTAGNQYAQTAQATDAATAKAAQDALAGANTTFQGGLNTQLTAAQQKYQADNAAIQAALKSGQLSPDQLRQTGLQGGMSTMGLDLSKYVNPGTNPTVYNTANADQYAQAAALAQLAGAGGTNFLPQEYAGQAGGAGDPWSYNNAGFTSDRNAAIGAYNAALANTNVNSSVGSPTSLKDWLNTIPNDNSVADWGNGGGNGPIQQAIAKLNEIGKNYGQGNYALTPDQYAPAGYDLSEGPSQTIQNTLWGPINQQIGGRQT